MLKHTIVAVVSGNPSVLGRIGNLLARARVQVDTLVMEKRAAEENRADIRLSLDAGSQQQVDRVMAQLEKLVDVISLLQKA